MNCTTRINLQESADQGNPSVAAAIKDIKKAIQVKILKYSTHHNIPFVTVYLDPAPNRLKTVSRKFPTIQKRK